MKGKMMSKHKIYAEIIQANCKVCKHLKDHCNGVDHTDSETALNAVCFEHDPTKGKFVSENNIRFYIINDSLKKYTVYVPEIHIQKVEIRANNPEEAALKVMNGEGEYLEEAESNRDVELANTDYNTWETHENETNGE